MERLDEVKSLLRQKKQEYQGKRDDYEILKQNMKTNVEEKKVLRTEIDALRKEKKRLQNGPAST